MAIDFPNSPTTGDTYTTNGKTYRWDGTVWGVYGTFTVDSTASDTEPTGVGNGHIWYRSDQSQTLIRYDGVWVEVGSAGGFDSSSTSFPSSLDSGTGFAAVEALQAKVGADSSAVTSSHDYKIAQLEAGATGGKIIAVKHALFTGTQTNSTAAGGNFSVTDLSITHTLADSANKLIISAYIGLAGSENDLGEVGLAVADGGTLIAIGDAANNRTRVGAGGRLATPGDAIISNSLSVTFVYEPGDTSSHTYTVEALNHSGGTGVVYINRTENDANSTNRPRGSSGFVIQEVAA